MRSAHHCLEKAAQCEALADDARDDMSRTMLRATAQHWRTLGHAASLAESGEGLASQMLRTRPSPGDAGVRTSALIANAKLAMMPTKW